MNRREFFKLASLGAGTLLVAPTVLGAAWTDQWHAEDAVRFAVAHALAAGATYADACVGQCTLVGHHASLPSLDLMDSQLMGMRVAMKDGLRIFVLYTADEATLSKHLTAAIAAPFIDGPQRDHWIAAQFDAEKLLAHHSSDSTMGTHLASAGLRYGRPLTLPAHSSAYHFCDLLLQH